MNVRDPFLDSMEIHGCFKSDDSWKGRTPRSETRKRQTTA